MFDYVKDYLGIVVPTHGEWLREMVNLRSYFEARTDTNKSKETYMAELNNLWIGLFDIAREQGGQCLLFDCSLRVNVGVDGTVCLVGQSINTFFRLLIQSVIVMGPWVGEISLVRVFVSFGEVFPLSYWCNEGYELKWFNAHYVCYFTSLFVICSVHGCVIPIYRASGSVMS